MSFLKLPPEVLASILGYAEPLTIRRCQQVCSKLRDLVATNLRIQYILELDLCGYVPPLAPRKDLTDAEKIEVLRGHRGNWHGTSIGPPEFIGYTPEQTSRIALEFLVNGTYPYLPIYHAGTERKTKLHFYELQSANRGTTFNHWEHDVSNYRNIESFTFEPEQDLLVIFELVEIREISSQEDLFDEHFRIHTRTISSHGPHPAATLPAFDLRLTMDEIDSSSLTARVCGKLVAVMLSSSGIAVPSALVVCDWVTGSKIARFDFLDRRCEYTFSFLSEEFFMLVSSVVKPVDQANAEYGPNPSGLNVYRLNNSDIRTLKPRLAACFLLPDHNLYPRDGLSKDGIRTFLNLHDPLTRPTPPSYWQTPSAGQPRSKVFESGLSDYMLRLEFLRRAEDSSHEAGALYVSVQSLMGVFARGNDAEPTLIPWATWKHCTSWRKGKDWVHLIREVLCGHRAVSLRGFPPVRSPGLYVYEFYRKSDNGEGSTQEVTVLDGVFADSGRPYTRRVIEDKRSDFSRYGAVHIDDEHIVFTSRPKDLFEDGGPDPGIWVYSL